MFELGLDGCLLSLGGLLLQLLTSFLCGVDGCTDGVDHCGFDCWGGLVLQEETCPKIDIGTRNKKVSIIFISSYFIINIKQVDYKL